MQLFVFNKRIPKMARIHSRTKGKSGSKRPVEVDLSFISLKKEEVVKIIIDLANKDVSLSIIGLTLRDSYGIPSVKAFVGKSLAQIIEEGGVSRKVPEDLAALTSKVLRLKKHLENNHRDTHNKRGLILMESKLRRLLKYYKSKGKIEGNWSY